MDATTARTMAAAQIVAAALEAKVIGTCGDDSDERAIEIGKFANTVFRYLKAADLGRSEPEK